MALETEIAKAHWDRTVGRNRNLTYNKLSKDELLALGGDFPLAVLLDQIGIGDQDLAWREHVTATDNGLAGIARFSVFPAPDFFDLERRTGGSSVFAEPLKQGVQS